MIQEALVRDDIQITINDPKISLTEFQEVLPKIIDFVQNAYYEY